MKCKKCSKKIDEGKVKFRHILKCGDSTVIHDTQEVLVSEKAKLCFTSPPYADQREYDGGLDLSPEKLSRIFNTDCSIFCINLGMKIKDGEVVRYWDAYIERASQYALKLTAWNVWDKGTSVSLGMMRDDFILNHEWIFVFSKDKFKTRPIVKNKHGGEDNLDHGGGGRIRSSKNRGYGSIQGKKKIREHRELSSIISVTSDTGQRLNHPAKFPVLLPQHYIEAITNEGDTVFEPFAGSGSTMIACEKLKRSCRMIEISPKYCELILKRFINFVGHSRGVFLLKENNGDNVPYSEIFEKINYEEN